MTSEFQPGDRLRDILQRAKERAAGSTPAPTAKERAHREASVDALLDRDQPLPDARALSRLYQDQALTVRLPESPEAEVLPPPVWLEEERQPSQPVMSPADIRGVMQKLQSEFGGSFALYEIPEAPSDDFGARTMQQVRDQELAELKRLADESAQSNWVFVLGAVVVVVILGVFIYLAAVGPLKASPAPVATPSATASAAHL